MYKLFYVEKIVKYFLSKGFPGSKLHLVDFYRGTFFTSAVLLIRIIKKIQKQHLFKKFVPIEVNRLLLLITN